MSLLFVAWPLRCCCCSMLSTIFVSAALPQPRGHESMATAGSKAHDARTFLPVRPRVPMRECKCTHHSPLRGARCPVCDCRVAEECAQRRTEDVLEERCRGIRTWGLVGATSRSPFRVSAHAHVHALIGILVLPPQALRYSSKLVTAAVNHRLTDVTSADGDSSRARIPLVDVCRAFD